MTSQAASNGHQNASEADGGWAFDDIEWDSQSTASLVTAMGQQIGIGNTLEAIFSRTDLDESELKDSLIVAMRAFRSMDRLEAADPLVRKNEGESFRWTALPEPLRAVALNAVLKVSADRKGRHEMVSVFTGLMQTGALARSGRRGRGSRQGDMSL